MYRINNDAINDLAGMGISRVMELIQDIVTKRHMIRNPSQYLKADARCEDYPHTISATLVQI